MWKMSDVVVLSDVRQLFKSLYHSNCSDRTAIASFSGVICNLPLSNKIS
jgi:hypothetical protein